MHKLSLHLYKQAKVLIAFEEKLLQQFQIIEELKEKYGPNVIEKMQAGEELDSFISRLENEFNELQKFKQLSQEQKEKVTQNATSLLKLKFPELQKPLEWVFKLLHLPSYAVAKLAQFTNLTKEEQKKLFYIAVLLDYLPPGAHFGTLGVSIYLLPKLLIALLKQLNSEIHHQQEV